MTTELNKKPRKKREPNKYFVVANGQSVAEFNSNKKAIKFIKEEFDAREHGLTEHDKIQVVKCVERVVSEHPVQYITLIRAAQLDL